MNPGGQHQAQSQGAARRRGASDACGRVRDIPPSPGCRLRARCVRPARSAGWSSEGLHPPAVARRIVAPWVAACWGLFRRCPDQACRHLRCRANPTLAHDQVLQPRQFRLALDVGGPARRANLPWPGNTRDPVPAKRRICYRPALWPALRGRTAFAGQAAQHGVALVRLGAGVGCGDAGRYRTSLPPASDARPGCCRVPGRNPAHRPTG